MQMETMTMTSLLGLVKSQKSSSCCVCRSFAAASARPAGSHRLINLQKTMLSYTEGIVFDFCLDTFYFVSCYNR